MFEALRAWVNLFSGDPCKQLDWSLRKGNNSSGETEIVPLERIREESGSRAAYCRTIVEYGFAWQRYLSTLKDASGQFLTPQAEQTAREGAKNMRELAREAQGCQNILQLLSYNNRRHLDKHGVLMRRYARTLDDFAQKHEKCRTKSSSL